MRHIIPAGVLLAAALLASCKAPDASMGGSTTASVSAPAMAQRLVDLEARAQRLEDINAIKRLQRAYGYYLDEARWDDVADLFAANATVEIGADGVYRGRERIRLYYHEMGKGRQGLRAGQLNEHLQLMPVITLQADGQRARGTWRDVILSGELGKDAYWAEG
ncbi:MAG TPA: nuclear transport factor 2 family protein, partial [Steroidobacteraceae bacterium]|nr:nuclear transport factor 2 family protein [Steroidobacteraceae bacterium]